MLKNKLTHQYNNNIKWEIKLYQILYAREIHCIHEMLMLQGSITFPKQWS